MAAGEGFTRRYDINGSRSGCDDTGADIVTDGKTPCNIIRFRQEIFENGFRKY
ncbi:MAG: hypothetical protein K6G43_09040 [Lachnospiraceae bacterium]|nr:hypothetical protein [Lachnospiraceae bacterium]